MVDWCALVAFFAVERKTQHLRAAPGRSNPCAILPRRIVAHVLIVATAQLRHPVTLVVTVIAGDWLLHGVYKCSEMGKARQ